MSGKIFISYRREDSGGATGRVYDRLELNFGHSRIFMDVDAIEPGEDFVKKIEDAVSTTDIFLVVIGPNWAKITDRAGNRRLDNPEDFVRLEVSSALKRNVRVIPVLVDNATMPRSTDLPDDLKPLTRRNAIEISHTRFSMDMDRLIHSIEQVFIEIESNSERIERSASNVHEQVQQERAVYEQFLQQQKPQNHAKPKGAPKNKQRIIGSLIAVSIILMCCCFAFFWWVNETYRWCVFFPFITGC